MKHVYIIEVWYSDIKRWIDIAYYSSRKKAEEYQKSWQEHFKNSPELGVKKPEYDVKIKEVNVW